MTHIASVNATYNGKYHCTVLEASRGAHLQGSFCIVALNNGYFEADVLCRAGMVETHNPAHENPQFQPLIAKNGSIPYVSGRADNETIVLEPLAYFDLSARQLVGSKGNPRSGTLVHLPDGEELVKFARENEFFFNAGYMPGHPEVLISLINRDYGPIAGPNGADQGGLGQAFHRIYGGKNGSGKTIFLLEGVVARAVKHRRMGLLMLDTKGDLVVEGKHLKPGFHFDPHQLLRDGGRPYQINNIADIRLTQPDMIIEILAKRWAKILGRSGDMLKMILGMALEELIETHCPQGVDLQHITLTAICDEVANWVGRGIGWSSLSARDRQELVDLIRNQATGRPSQNIWQREIVPLYSGRHTAEQIVTSVLEGHAIRMISLHGVREEHQTALMVEILRKIKTIGARNYHQDRECNAEVVIDEAPRWVPQIRDDNPYAGIIVDAINTTRAYGISWTFATQRLTAIDKNILAQCHTRFYCKGLSVGADLKHIEDDLGAEGLALYRTLNQENSYFCLVSGEELNFGSGGSYVALVGWAGQVNEEIKAHNSHIWKIDEKTRVRA